MWDCHFRNLCNWKRSNCTHLSAPLEKNPALFTVSVARPFHSLPFMGFPDCKCFHFSSWSPNKSVHKSEPFHSKKGLRLVICRLTQCSLLVKRLLHSRSITVLQVSSSNYPHLSSSYIVHFLSNNLFHLFRLTPTIFSLALAICFIFALAISFTLALAICFNCPVAIFSPYAIAVFFTLALAISITLVLAVSFTFV